MIIYNFLFSDDKVMNYSGSEDVKYMSRKWEE